MKRAIEDGEGERRRRQWQRFVFLATTIQSNTAHSLSLAHVLLLESNGAGNRTTVKRNRTSIEEIHNELGEYYFRRAYRMPFDQFCALLNLLSPHIKSALDPRAPNGPISDALRLSAALRYFAGGSSYDIMVVHGISHSSLFQSVWLVVDAIHSCKELQISFPEDEGDQRRGRIHFLFPCFHPLSLHVITISGGHPP
jgi:hypothetical protein